MANKTIDQYTALGTTPAAGDFFAIWDLDAGAQKKVSYANLFGATITGGGTIATGGYTLTVPATGTAALIAGSTWVPAITATTTSPTVTYTTQEGKYYTIGNIVFFSFYLDLATYSGGSGNLRVSLPVGAGTGDEYKAVWPVNYETVDLPANTIDIVFTVSPGNSFGNLRALMDDAAASILAVGALAANDIINCSGFYFTA
jgi:hypothetical protein